MALNKTTTYGVDINTSYTNIAETITGSKTFNNTIFTTGNIIDQPSLRHLRFERIDKGSVSSGTSTFDLSAANQQRLQVGGALTVAFSNWPTTGKFAEIMIEFVNGGSATITWPTISWIKSDGTIQATPTRTLQTSGTDFSVFWSRDAGTTIYGKII